MNSIYSISLSIFLTITILADSKAQNLLSMQDWTIGTGSAGIFGQNGLISENIREWGEGPNGKRVILWKAIPDGNTNADGGWDTNYFPIHHANMYRFSIWLKKTNSGNGTTYFGCNFVLKLNGEVDGNPYFWSGTLPELNKWYLLVGYVHGSGDESTTNYGAIYDGDTGAKVLGMTDFKFSTASTQTNHRTYLFYDPNVSDRQYFYAPRVDLVNGNEPSIQSLLGILHSDSSQSYFPGKVGIGTTTPSTALDIKGHLTLDGDGGEHSRIYLSDATTENNKVLLLLNSSKDHSASGLKVGGLLVSDNYGFASPGKNDLVIKGKVGIGTANLTEKLSVNGKIRAQEIKVEASPWPDYVFTNSYLLPTLHETEKHIKEKGHLQGIPSAAEVKANGINLGEMNARLLQKIEELTLHLIEQHKIISAQQKDIEVLKSKLK